MAKDKLAGKESRLLRLRRLIVPDWLWQLTWLRHLPRYYRSIVWSDCTRSGRQVVCDFLYIFFKLKTIPEHYGPCRLWEVPRKDWALYCGSPYTPITWGRLAKRVYPVEYQVLYNDKVVGAQLCKGLNVRQPAILGSLQPDAPWRESLASFFNSSGKRQLMLKPIFGRSGIGIVLVERNDGGIIVQTPTTRIPLSDFQLEWPVFVQEIIQQDPRIAAIWSSSVNTVRVITLYTAADDIIIVGCAMRFGVGSSFVDNWSAGGVAVGVDPVTGLLKKYAYDIKGNRYTQHPSSQFTFEGFQFPEWQSILDTARKVQRELPFSKIAGMDLCLDQDAQPVLIEINGLPDFILVEQLNGPLLADKQTLKAFAEYDLLLSKSQRRLVEHGEK